jgi:1-deoxy-D-xylulose-5-phosphate synthase
LRYPKDLVPPEQPERSACAEPFELGKSVAVREAADSALAIVAYGAVLTEAIKAAEILQSEGIGVDVINARFAAPVDEKIISLLEKGKAIMTVEDHRLTCGFGSAVLEAAAVNLPDHVVKKIAVIGMPGRFIKHDSRGAQLMQAGINADEIAQKAKNMLVFTK